MNPLCISMNFSRSSSFKTVCMHLRYFIPNLSNDKTIQTFFIFLLCEKRCKYCSTFWRNSEFWLVYHLFQIFQFVSKKEVDILIHRIQRVCKCGHCDVCIIEVILWTMYKGLQIYIAQQAELEKWEMLAQSFMYTFDYVQIQNGFSMGRHFSKSMDKCIHSIQLCKHCVFYKEL